MNVVLFGATGMVGSGVLNEAVADPRVTTILVVGRSPTGASHPKIREVLHADFFDYSGLAGELADKDACFFCLGVSSVGMGEEEYRRVTYDLTLAAAEAFLAASPGATFCYVSGAGTDSTETGRLMWARVKGRTENALLRLPFRSVHLFRPGYIQPLGGVRSKTRLYRVAYALAARLYPLLERLAPGHVTTSEAVGRAMVRVVTEGYSGTVLETPDINLLGRRAEA